MPTSKLVIVIDDDRLTLEAMDGLLRSWGYAVVTAVSDQQAEEFLNGRRPDLIISDYHLADNKTGAQAIERLRGTSQIPALVISGDAKAARAQNARHEVLFKPLDPALLEQALDRIFPVAKPTDETDPTE